MHKVGVLPCCEIVHKGDMTVEHNLFAIPSMFLGLVGVCWN